MSLTQADGTDKMHISSGGINENILTIYIFFVIILCMILLVDTSVILM
jgi:hypothetical protein